MSQDNKHNYNRYNDKIFSKLRQIHPTKNTSNLIMMYDEHPASRYLAKQFDNLRKKEFVDNKGVTFLGKIMYVAGDLGISFLAALMLADFVVQHARKPEHNTSCRVSTYDIRATLSPIV